jgi:DTW domain-containing protein YfiP
MVARSRKKPRCEGCGLSPALCACALLPTVEVSTPLVVVQHVGEAIKPTNTVRLLQRMVPAVRVLPWGMREPPFDPSPLQTGTRFELLFPGEDAPVLEPAADPDRGFVLLDGTWHQCSRMARRVPVVQDLPCVALPDGPPSIWVRTQHDPRGVSTFEAALRVFELRESPEIVGALRQAFEIVTARLLFMKGRLRTPDVPVQWPD